MVSKRQFAGYWEYLIDGAIFTSPPRPDLGGAALINKDGELVGIGSLFVMDALTPGERLPGNMFVPIDLLKPVLDEMIATGRQKGGTRPWIGVNSLEEDGRLKVMRVSERQPRGEGRHRARRHHPRARRARRSRSLRRLLPPPLVRRARPASR